MTRKPVAAVQTKNDYTIVICDDGTSWLLVRDDEGEQAWTELTGPIPGTAAADK